MIVSCVLPACITDFPGELLEKEEYTRFLARDTRAHHLVILSMLILRRYESSSDDLGIGEIKRVKN